MTKFFCIEGPDRVGKATQSNLLNNYLVHKGYTSKVVEIPHNDSFTYKMIYGLVRSKYIKQFKNLFQILQIINKFIWQVKESLTIKRNSSEFIIFDRWKMSSLVYGEAEGVWKFLSKLSNRILLNPDITIILMGAPFPKNNLDEYEKNTTLQDLVRCIYTDQYLKYVDMKDDGYNGSIHLVYIDNMTIEDIHNEIIKIISE